MGEIQEVTEVKKDLRVFNSATAKVRESLANLAEIKTVKSKENADAVLLTLKDAAQVPKLIEKKRKEMVKPFNDTAKEINNYAKELVKNLPDEILRVKGLVQDFQEELNAKESEKEKKLEEERLAALEEKGASGEQSLEDMMNDSLVSHDIEKEEDVPVKIEKTHVKGMKKVWTHEVVDYSLIPQDYMVIDEKAIRAAIKAGVRDIPGLKIYQENKLAV